MGKKAERIVYASLTEALERLGIVKVARLLEEAVEDTEALENGLFDLSLKREAQFAKGIALIIKARKGAERDDCEDDEQLEDDDERHCDCGNRTCRCHLPEHITSPILTLGDCDCCQKRIEETVEAFLLRMQHWTGLHISINMALAEIMRVDFNVEKLVKKMRRCQNVGELVKVLTKKAGGQIRIRESKKGAEVPAYRSLVNNFPGFVVTTAK